MRDFHSNLRPFEPLSIRIILELSREPLRCITTGMITCDKDVLSQGTFQQCSGQFFCYHGKKG